MDALRPGLRRALEPEGRGCVHRRILRGGVIAPGDPVELIGQAAE
jgi:MOSC domain-containing protein YiiM